MTELSGVSEQDSKLFRKTVKNLRGFLAARAIPLRVCWHQRKAQILRGLLVFDSVQVLRRHLVGPRPRTMPTLFFVHIGKNAGTTLTRAFEDSPIETCIYNLQHWKPTLQLTDFPPNSLCICVRDPIRRFVSAWRSRYEQGFPHHHKAKFFRNGKVKWKKGLEIIFEDHATPESYLQAILRGQARMHYMDHFTPQTRVLGGLDAVARHMDRFHFVFQFEHLAQHWEVFLKGQKLPLVPLPHLHRADHNKDYPPYTPRCPSNWRDLSDESHDLLRKLYLDDYRLIQMLGERFPHFQVDPTAVDGA